MQKRVRSIRHAASEVSAAARVDTSDRARRGDWEGGMRTTVQEREVELQRFQLPTDAPT